MRRINFVFSVILLISLAVFVQASQETKKILYPRQPFSNYQLIVERNIFQPQGELASSLQTGKARVKISLANLYLTGIVYDGEKVLAIIEDRRKKSEDFFAQGDSIGEAKILEIKEKEQQVTLEYQGEEIVLSLSPLEKPKKASPSAPKLPSVLEREKLPGPIKTKKSLFPIRERLGIHAREISPQLSKRLKLPLDKGLYVLLADKNAPAGFANLSGGDILTEINGAPVTTIKEAQAAMKDVSAGNEIILGVVKKGKKEAEAITLTILKE